MKKNIISESYKNRIQELAGILEENSQKIMNLGFDESIANYLSDLDKKRGIFFADSITRDFASKKGIESSGNIKQILQSVNQSELYDYIKSRENDINNIIDFIKNKQGQVDLKSFSGFEDLLSAAKADSSDAELTKGSEIKFEDTAEKFLRKIDYDAGIELGILALRSFAKHTLQNSNINFATEEPSVLLNAVDQRAFMNFLWDNENQFINIIEWLNSPLRNENGEEITAKSKIAELKNHGFEDFDDALAYANYWHSNLTASGKLLNPTAGKIIERYPDGYYWVDLQTNQSKDEAQAMGHCGTDLRATTLLSLRDEKGEPHITISYNGNNKTITQVKGKENKKPIEKYMKYAMDFLKNMAKNGDLEGVAWSYYGDLTPEEIDSIFKVNPKTYFKFLKRGIKKTSNIGVNY